MRLLFAVAVFVVLAGAGVGASPAAEVVAAPRLTVGDSWTYHTNTSLGPDFYLEGHITLTVAGHGPTPVEGVVFDAYRLQVDGAGTAAGTFAAPFGSAPASGSWVVSGEETVESAGLKTIESVLDLEANGTLYARPVTLLFQLRLQNTTKYRFTQDDWHFPLGIGNATIVRSKMNFSEDFSLFYGIPSTPRHSSGVRDWNLSYAIEARTSVETPAGHFDTYRIRQTFPDGSFNLFFYSPVVGNEARSETYNGTQRVATTELMSYRYQALEPPTFLGLTSFGWGVVAAVLVVVAVVAMVFFRRGRRKPERPSKPPTEP